MWNITTVDSTKDIITMWFQAIFFWPPSTILNNLLFIYYSETFLLLFALFTYIFSKKTKKQMRVVESIMSQMMTNSRRGTVFFSRMCHRSVEPSYWGFLKGFFSECYGVLRWRITFKMYSVTDHWLQLHLKAKLIQRVTELR